MPASSRLYHELMLGLWLAWCLYWLLSAALVKRTERRESTASRLSHIVPLGIGAWLIFAPLHGPRWLTMQLLPEVPARYLLALCLVTLGLLFSVWGRVHLGRNWSASVTAKQGHELVRTGPYALVRHPIYTGLLLALLGSALDAGAPRAVLGLAIVTAGFLHKRRIEERFMSELFPGPYARYREQVPALLPFTKVRRSAPRSAPRP